MTIEEFLRYARPFLSLSPQRANELLNDKEKMKEFHDWLIDYAQEQLDNDKRSSPPSKDSKGPAGSVNH